MLFEIWLFRVIDITEQKKSLSCQCTAEPDTGHWEWQWRTSSHLIARTCKENGKGIAQMPEVSDGLQWKGFKELRGAGMYKCLWRKFQFENLGIGHLCKELQHHIFLDNRYFTFERCPVFKFLSCPDPLLLWEAVRLEDRDGTYAVLSL